jgi:hypothetical protein
MNTKFIKLLQWRIARTSVGASTARKMGPKGTIKIACQFLMKVNLKRFRKFDATDYQMELDKITDKFVAVLPKKAQHWGSARKFLNIFMRGVLYNRYLCEYYDLVHLEPYLEIPLDSHVVKGLRREKGSNMLPRWRGVIHIKPEENTAFQEFAEKAAHAKGTYRVHLDLLYWRGDHLLVQSKSLRKRNTT